jgi:hypothetical protein
MAEKKSAVKGSEGCDVIDCSNPGERSISGKAATDAGLKVDEELKRVHLCKEHYKAYKKQSRQDRLLDTLGR